jgi:hypothetical protein
LGHFARSVPGVKVALSIVSLVSQLFPFRVDCKGMILKGFGFVAFFAGVKASSFCIHLACPVCSLSVVRGEWSRLFCSHKGRNLPEVSIASFLLKSIISEFLFSGFKSAPDKTTGITAEENTVMATVLLSFTVQNTLFTEVCNYSRSYTRYYYILLQSVKSATDAFTSYFRPFAMFKLRVV